MIAELICVGTELLMGQIVNTDAAFLAEQLAAAGVTLYRQQVVGDNAARLTEAIETALTRADLVLLCGGLGPTEDDLTKETAAAVWGLPLALYPDEWKRIEDYFALRGRCANENNRKQACFPRDCTILKNDFGTAPGCLMERDGKRMALLPGPPRELKPMFQNELLPLLIGEAGQRFVSRTLCVFGLGESEVTTRLKELIAKQQNPTIAPYIRTNEVTLRVTARARDEAEGEALLAPVLCKIRTLLGDCLYSEDGGTLAGVCHRRLLALGQTLSVAESCTGGLLTSAFVDLSGSSGYLLEGDVTYSNAAKQRRLGVSKETLERDGAVSAACAKEMAEGMRSAAGSDYALSTTGYAGPEGKDVGLVFVALASKEGTIVKELHLRGDRARIRDAAVLHALDIFRRKLCTIQG